MPRPTGTGGVQASVNLGVQVIQLEGQRGLKAPHLPYDPHEKQTNKQTKGV